MRLDGFRSKVKNTIRIRNQHVREGLAEFLGTFVLISFGAGSVAQSVLSRSANGEYLSINLAWGLAVAFGIFVSGGVSGGHLNPAVSMTMAILGRMSIRRLVIYTVAQFVGAFCAAACVFGIYYDAINMYDDGVRSVVGANATAGVFATYPQDYLSILQGFFDQVFGTMLLCICVMALTDSRNMNPSSGLLPFSVGALVTVIGLSFGMNCGYAINPARDFGPRMFTFAAGYGSEVFSAYDYWFWVPIVGPYVGAVVGAWIYLVFIGIHLEERPQTGSIDTKTFTDPKETKEQMYL